MTELRYTLEGRPLSWKRAATSGRRRVTDPEMREAKRRHGWACLAAMPPALRATWDTTGAYEVEVTAYLPANASRAGDVDNLAKLVMDALQGVLYANDRQVSDLVARRRFDPANPRTEVRVVRLEGA